jgi:hypothetical protein
MVARLRELRTRGVQIDDCAGVLTVEFDIKPPLAYNQVEQASKRYGIGHLLARDKRATRYEPMTLPMDDYAICSDVHAPFHSEEWVNRFLTTARQFGIRKAIVVGDLLDCAFASKWYSDDKRTLDAELDMVKPVFEGLDGAFDKIYWSRGNHENRVGMRTDGVVQLKHLGPVFAGDLWDRKITYSCYDKFYIEDKWMLVHPKSYRQTIVSVAKDLAAKYHRNVINTHGHFVGMGFDRSARFLCVDLGGLFDVGKIDYVGLDTSTHPAWGNGFGLIKDGKFWHFTEATDWAYWGRK